MPPRKVQPKEPRLDDLPAPVVKQEAIDRMENWVNESTSTKLLAWQRDSLYTGMLQDINTAIRTMLWRWGYLQTALTKAVNALTAYEWVILPYVATKNDKPTPEAQDMAQLVDDCLYARPELRQGRWELDFDGVIKNTALAFFRADTVLEIDWGFDAEGSRWVPRRYRKILPKYYAWTTQSDQPDALMLYPNGTGQQPCIPFPENKFIVALGETLGDHPIFANKLVSLIPWYIAAEFGLKEALNFIAHYAQPIKHVKYGAAKQYEDAVNMMKKFGNNTWLVSPKSLELEIINASQNGNGSSPHLALLQAAQNQVDMVIGGQKLASGTADTGANSRALGEVHNEVRKEVVESMADFVKRVLNTQLIPAILRLNLGELPEHLPSIEFTDPNSHADESKLNFVMRVLETMPVAKQWPYEQLNIPMPEDGAELFEAVGSTPYGGSGTSPFDEEDKDEDGTPDDTDDEGDDDDDEINAANPYGCNQYGHREGHEGGSSSGSSLVDRYHKQRRGFHEAKVSESEGDIENMHANGWTDDDIHAELDRIDKARKGIKENEKAPANESKNDRLEREAELYHWRQVERRAQDNLWKMQFTKRGRGKKSRISASDPGDSEEYDPQEDDEITAADSRRLSDPMDIPGEGKCYTKDCKRHGGKKEEPAVHSELSLRKNKKADRARQDKTDTGKKKGEQKPTSKPEVQGFSEDFGNASTREAAIAHTHELLNLLSKTVPGSVKWDNNITLEQINEYNMTMRALHERYPYVDIRQLGSIVSGDDDAFALTDTYKAKSYKPVGLVLNADHEKHGIHGIGRTKAWKQLPESERRKYDIDNPRAYNRQFVGVEKGKRTSVKDALIHEWGHALHAPLIVDNDHRSRNACASVETAYNIAKESGDIRNISFYAKGSSREFLAECFSARVRGEKLPSYIDKMLDSVIDAAKNKTSKK